jgi:hypothetical protein
LDWEQIGEGRRRDEQKMAVTPGGIHTLFVGLHEGMLTLAAISIILIVLAKLYGRTLGKTLYIDTERIIAFVEPASVLGALGGSIFLLVSAYVGLFLVTNGLDTLVTSPLLMNKVMMAIFAEEFWIIFLVIRAKFGKNIWNRSALSGAYAIIGLIGFLFTMETGSLGGHLAGTGSILDPIYDWAGINPEQFFSLNGLETYALIGLTIVVGLAFGYTYWKSRAHRSVAPV